ncbi:MAG: hypothetical protein MZV63_00135 [Marinilabiliales bacterium]|nr:hypothetical protein [Marinilabiliales bacterium]
MKGLNLEESALTGDVFQQNRCLKSAQVFDYLTHASDYGITVAGEVKPDFRAIIARSRSVADGMSKGIQFLFKKE